MTPLLERFIRYIAVDTRSEAGASVTPGTPGQTELARILVGELKELGLHDAKMDAHAYVTASLPGRGAAPDAPAVGLIAHLDTSGDYSGTGVKARVVENYDGGPVELAAGRRLDPGMFPALKTLIGRTLVVPDGDTLLGGDDKAGVAEIMTVLAELRDNPSLRHPPIRVAFTPDEEIGHGAELLDIAAFGADFAYTLDGGGRGEIEFENFNAAAATVAIRGLAIHPGYAKDKMINAILVGKAFLDRLPETERPETTEDRQGFFHVTDFSGDASSARIDLIVRDHAAASFRSRKELLARIAAELNERWPAGGEGPRLVLTVRDQYRNMEEKIRPHMHIVETAREAMRDAGVEPRTVPIRGGTDGARLSWRGLPTPNLSCGQYNPHGPYEFVVLEDMRAAVAVVIRILARYAGQ